VVSSYLTIARDGEAEIEAKRSRFRCTLVRVEDEPAARAVVERLRRRHWDARHHCSAFVLGAGRDVERASDDGEPAGTAGAPMLEVLRGHGGEGVSDVVAVVSRWFGGTLLGAGGLVRAYGDAVRAGLEVTGTRRRRLLTELALELGHSDAGRVEGELRSRGVVVLASTYAERVTLLLGAAPAEVSRVHTLVAELTGGGAAAGVVGERWVDAPRAGPEH
jgi:uncharacterized YigZ family protein